LIGKCQNRFQRDDTRHLPYPDFYWFEIFLHLDPVSKFPETTNFPGNFVGFADNVGNELIFKILKNLLTTVLHISVVWSAADANHQNKRVAFKPDVQDRINRLDLKPSPIIRNNHHKQKIRGINDDDVSNRTGLK
jgi:hypothetical protein